jgi:hypothetical protein
MRRKANAKRPASRGQRLKRAVLSASRGNPAGSAPRAGVTGVGAREEAVPSSARGARGTASSGLGWVPEVMRG